jgi:hypothetical protein
MQVELKWIGSIPLTPRTYRFAASTWDPYETAVAIKTGTALSATRSRLIAGRVATGTSQSRSS